MSWGSRTSEHLRGLEGLEALLPAGGEEVDAHPWANPAGTPAPLHTTRGN